MVILSFPNVDPQRLVVELRSMLKITLITNLLHEFTCSESNYEMLFIELTSSPKPVVVACVYRPPSTDVSVFNEKLHNVLEILESEKKDIYILGDFNINLLNYGIHNKTNEFLDTMFSFNLYPLISKPTRINDTKATLIDNIFTNTIEEKKQSGIIYSDLSDHFPVFSIVSGKTVKYVPKYFKHRVINDSTLCSFNVKMLSVDWQDVYCCENVNDSYNAFFEKFNSVYNTCFPLKSVKQRCKDTKKPWITKGILILLSVSIDCIHFF